MNATCDAEGCHGRAVIGIRRHDTQKHTPLVVCENHLRAVLERWAADYEEVPLETALSAQSVHALRELPT